MMVDNDRLIFDCPWCDLPLMVIKSEIGCAIFRHGVYKSTFMQINPHLSRDECHRLKLLDLTYGCNMPFRINKDKEKYLVTKCDFI